jgi:hypothetical protein
LTSGVIACRNNAPSTALFGVRTNDERDGLIKSVVNGFNCSKEGIQVAVNQNTRPERLNAIDLLDHTPTTMPSVFELDVCSVQLEGSSQG